MGSKSHHLLAEFIFSNLKSHHLCFLVLIDPEGTESFIYYNTVFLNRSGMDFPVLGFNDEQFRSLLMLNMLHTNMLSHRVHVQMMWAGSVSRMWPFPVWLTGISILVLGKGGWEIGSITAHSSRAALDIHVHFYWRSLGGKSHLLKMSLSFMELY